MSAEDSNGKSRRGKKRPTPEPLKALSNGLRVLAILDQSGGESSVSKIASELGMTRGGVWRILNTLKEFGYVEQRADGASYAITLQLWEMGVRMLNRVGLREIARPYLEQLTERVGEPVHLAVLSQGEALYMDKTNGTQPTQVYLYIGMRVPLHATGSGKVFLAFDSGIEKALMLDSRPLQAFTEATITDRESLAEALKKVRAQGYAESRGEYRVQVQSIAAPIYNHERLLVAALGTSFPVGRYDVAMRNVMANNLLTVAAAISRHLGA